MKYQTIIDDTTTTDITYICRAELGRNETSPLWQIIAIDETGSEVKVKYPRRADGMPSSEFIFRADQRASLTYSFISG